MGPPKLGAVRASASILLIQLAGSPLKPKAGLSGPLVPSVLTLRGKGANLGTSASPRFRSMSSKSVPFAGIQLHRTVGFKQVEFEGVVDLDERNPAISKQRLGLVQGC